MGVVVIGALLVLLILVLIIVPGAGKWVLTSLTQWILFTLIALVIGFLLVTLFNINYQSFLARTVTGGRFIDPEELIGLPSQPSSLRYENVLFLDTDGDGENERVLLYRYDLVSGRSPLGATVLDLNACRPRGIDSYDLFPLDQDYLTEAGYLLETRDIPNVGGRHELLIWGRTPDNVRTELAIFQWFDLNEACRVADPRLRGYALLGNFRGSGGIQIVSDTVRVLERAFERSQLSVVTAYKPRDGSFRALPAGLMYPPLAKAVEFTFGAPTPTTQTYYPEKTVVAFYMSIGLRTADARALLDDEAAKVYIQGSLGKEVAEPGRLTSMAEVKEIAYYPDANKERAHEMVAVEVEVLNRRDDGSLADRLYRYRVWVKGLPNPKALPFGCEWRIVRFELIS